MAVFSRFSTLVKRYPIIRGMLSYAAIWPTSALIQQTFIQGKTWENYDWSQVAKYSLFGCFFTAPTLYGWVRISTYIWPQTTLRTAIAKAAVEQVTYGPAAMCCFFFGMSLLENQTVEQAMEQVKSKFLPTYKVALCFWPFLQTINFALIPERNRVPFVSVCSLIWCCFLSYMHQVQIRQKQAQAQLQMSNF